jgi:hypothetical protein
LDSIWEGKVMEPFDWDIGPKSGRWTREAVARRLCHLPDTSDRAEGLGLSEHKQLTLLAELLETLGLDKAVRVGKLEDWKAALAALEKQRSATRKGDENDKCTGLVHLSLPHTESR